MAKTRLVNTSFWSDPFIQELSAKEKLVYLYLITNERTSICGIYEITSKTISFDTNIQEKEIQQIVAKLCQSGKIKKHENWIYLLNFAKHQKNNPSVKQGIDRAIKALPAGIFDRLCTDCVQVGLLKPKLELELKPNGDTGVSKSKTPSQLEERTRVFEILWVPYPKHRNKGQARKAFDKIKNPPIEKMLATIERMKETPDWKKENGKYIPYLSTWLNAEGWEDEAEVGLVKDDAFYINEMREIEFHKFRKKYGDDMARKYLNHSQI